MSMGSELTSVITDAFIRDLLRAYYGDYGPSFADCMRQVEQAVRAQWAAEVARLTAALKKANDQAEHFEREWYLRGDALEAVTAERDSAQAEAKTLRGALETAVAALADGLWDYGPGQDEHDKCNEVLAFCRAALQPGDQS